MAAHSDRGITRVRLGGAAGPGALWWVGHAIGGFGLGGLFLVWGLVVLSRGEAWIPLGLRRSIALEGTSAALFGWAMLVACPGLIAHMFLTCFDPIKHMAATGARFAAGVALLLLIAALVYPLVAVV